MALYKPYMVQFHFRILELPLIKSPTLFRHLYKSVSNSRHPSIFCRQHPHMPNPRYPRIPCKDDIILRWPQTISKYWLVVYLPLWKILVSWDYYSQYMEKQKMFQTTNQNMICFHDVHLHQHFESTALFNSASWLMSCRKLSGRRCKTLMSSSCTFRGRRWGNGLRWDQSNPWN